MAEETIRVDLDEAVQAYRNLRSERDRIRSEYEAKDNELKELLGEIDQVFLNICTETNANSFNTGHGTVIRQVKERFVCNDWDGFRKFELEHPEYDFREKRVHQGNIKQYMDEHRDEGLPPGTNSMREFQIVVRKSSK